MRYLVVCLVITSFSIAISYGEWTGQVNIDPMTDERIITMSTFNTADLVDAFFFGSAIPELIILFPENDKSPLIVVDYNKFVGISGRESTCSVRIDDNLAQEYPVVVDQSSEMIGLYIGPDSDVEEFFKDLLNGSELLFRFSPTGQAPVTTSFSLSGITAVSRYLGIDVEYYLNLGVSTPPSSYGASSVSHYSSSNPAPRVVHPRSSAVWVAGKYAQIRWAEMQGTQVSISLIDELGVRTPIGRYPNEGNAWVVVGPGLRESDSYRIEITDASNSTYQSSLFRYVNAELNLPYTEGSLPRRITERIHWFGEGEEVRLSLRQNGTEVAQLTNGWIENQGEFMPSFYIPDSFPELNEYEIVLQLRDSEGNEYVDCSGPYCLDPSDNSDDGAISLIPRAINQGSLDYPGDMDYWKYMCDNNGTCIIRIDGQGDYHLTAKSGNGSILAENHGNQLEIASYPGERLFFLIEDIDCSSSGSYEISFQFHKDGPSSHGSRSVVEAEEERVGKGLLTAILLIAGIGVAIQLLTNQ